MNRIGKSFAQNIRLFEADVVEQMLFASGFIDVRAATFADRYRRYAVVVGTKAIPTGRNNDISF